jgi:murein DD-endopeptidase MepM/ murein hydrolase activator NlpD
VPSIVPTSQVKSSQVKSSQVKSKLLLLGVTSVTVFASTISAALAENYLPYPAGKSYQVTQSWGGTTSHKGQNAIDFGMPINSPVVAAASGRVIRASNAGSNLPRGCNLDNWRNANYIQIDHGNGISSSYLHLNSINVSVGQTISQGQTIGLSGNTGYSCGPHLHFAFQKINSNYVWNHFDANVAQGFAETGNGMPIAGRSYTSQNRGIPAVSMLVNMQSGRALDAGGANGTQMYLHPQPLNNSFQRWKLESIGGDKYMVINVQSGRALDGGASYGAYAYIHPQQMLGNTWQQWKLEPTGAGYMLRNVASGRVLDGGGANGTATYMYQNPNGNPYQVWRLPG